MESSNSQKILLKPLKLTTFCPNLSKKGVPRGHAPNKKLFFSEITKSDYKLSKYFCFNKISYFFAELWLLFYFVRCFLLKSVIYSHNSFDLTVFQYVTGCTQLIYRYFWLYSMILWKRYLATPSKQWPTVMSDSNRPTISIAGDVSIVTSPVLLLVLLCAVYATVVGSWVAIPHEFLISWLLS